MGRSVAFRRVSRRTALVLAVAIASVFYAMPSAQNPRSAQMLLAHRDTIQSFDLVSGRGFQTGTVTGLVNGTSVVEFQLAPAGPPTGDVLPITFQNKVIITDIDGDQLRFDNDGTGSFHLGIPGFPFQGSGGPLSGTYVFTSGTGKYSEWTVGTTFSYRAAFTNPPNPPGALGTVYAEVARIATLAADERSPMTFIPRGIKRFAMSVFRQPLHAVDVQIAELVIPPETVKRLPK